MESYFRSCKTRGEGEQATTGHAFLCSLYDMMSPWRMCKLTYIKIVSHSLYLHCAYDIRLDICSVLFNSFILSDAYVHHQTRPPLVLIMPCHLFSTWWHHQMETFSTLLALGAGNLPVPVNSSHKGQWCRALMFSLICTRVNNLEAGDLRRNPAHYDVTVMTKPLTEPLLVHWDLWKHISIKYRSNHTNEEN